MASLENDTPYGPVEPGWEGKWPRMARGWSVLPSAWLVLCSGCPQPHGSLAQKQDAGGAMEASGCCGQAQLQLFCPLVQEDSAARARGAVCGLWSMAEGPGVPWTISPW